MFDHALSTFLTIHRTGGVGAAADLLHLSQPAVSRRLQRLERQLGAPLFERTRAGLRLTSAGEVLLPHAERVHAAELDASRAVAEHLGAPVGPVGVGIVGSLADEWFSGVLGATRAAHPAIEVAVTTGTSREIGEQVVRGEIAIGVCYLVARDPQVRAHHLFDEHLVLVCHPGHVLAGRQVADLGELRTERWLLFPDRGDHPESANSIARAALRRSQVPDALIRPIDSLSAQRALARAGYGLAFMPHGMVADDLATGSLATIDPGRDGVYAPVNLLTRDGAHLSPAAAFLIEALSSPPRPRRGVPRATASR